VPSRSAVRRGIVVAAFSNTNPSPVRGDIVRGPNRDDAAPERGWENHLGARNYKAVAPTALRRNGGFDAFGLYFSTERLDHFPGECEIYGVHSIDARSVLGGVRPGLSLETGTFGVNERIGLAAAIQAVADACGKTEMSQSNLKPFYE
jgi:hypothetical protein